VLSPVTRYDSKASEKIMQKSKKSLKFLLSVNITNASLSRRQSEKYVSSWSWLRLSLRWSSPGRRCSAGLAFSGSRQDFKNGAVLVGLPEQGNELGADGAERIISMNQNFHTYFYSFFKG